MKRVKVELIAKVVDMAFFMENRNLFEFVGINRRVGSRLYKSVYRYVGSYDFFNPRLSFGDIVIVSFK